MKSITVGAQAVRFARTTLLIFSWKKQRRKLETHKSRLVHAAKMSDQACGPAPAFPIVTVRALVLPVPGSAVARERARKAITSRGSPQLNRQLAVWLSRRGTYVVPLTCRVLTWLLA
jgi:hypothetical protein